VSDHLLGGLEALVHYPWGLFGGNPLTNLSQDCMTMSVTNIFVQSKHQLWSGRNCSVGSQTLLTRTRQYDIHIDNGKYSSNTCA